MLATCRPVILDLEYSNHLGTFSLAPAAIDWVDLVLSLKVGNAVYLKLAMDWNAEPQRALFPRRLLGSEPLSHIPTDTVVR